MPVVVVANITGDPKELLAKYDRIQAKLLEHPAEGMITHTCVELDDGIRVVNMFETEEQARAAQERPVFTQTLADEGMPEPERQILRVHNYRIL